MDLIDFSRYALALLVILGLLAGFAVALRYAQARGLLPGAAGPVRGARRMKAVESLMLDGRRRLVLVRIDKAEHAILLGASGETVIASGTAPDDPVSRPAPGPAERTP